MTRMPNIEVASTNIDINKNRKEILLLKITSISHFSLTKLTAIITQIMHLKRN